MVQPIPAWTSGMMRILLPEKTAWSHTVMICMAAVLSSSPQ